MIQQLLSATVTVIMLGSVVYFVVGFVLSIRDRGQVDPLVGADVEFIQVVQEEENTIDVTHTDTISCSSGNFASGSDLCDLRRIIVAVAPTSPVKVAPTVRKDICRLASSLGVARAYNRKTVDLLRVLRSEFGYA